MITGYTTASGMKTAVIDPRLSPHMVIYDSGFAASTPEKLWLSTGMQALDHAIELLYNTSSEVPCKQLALQAVSGLGAGLPKSKADRKDEQITLQLFLAAYASLGFMGTNIASTLGLSHALGYALGSPYGIPHAITFCLTLGHVVKLKSQKPENASQIARALPFMEEGRSGNEKDDTRKVADNILKLVNDLGLKTNLTDLRVGKDEVPTIVREQTYQSVLTERKNALGSNLLENLSHMVKERKPYEH
jgi:alcohol dehydrogenase class IV